MAGLSTTRPRAGAWVTVLRGPMTALGTTGSTVAMVGLGHPAKRSERTSHMLLRIGLALLTLHQGVAAVWAAFFPFGFFQNFPTPERGWLLLFPPYNEHMTRDFGFAGLPFV